MGEEVLHCLVEAVGLLAGVLGQGAVQGQLHEDVRGGCPASSAAACRVGVGGGREGEVEQDLPVGVRVVGGDHVDGEPCGEALAQPVCGACRGFWRARGP